MKYFNLIKDKSQTAVYPYIFDLDKIKNNFNGLEMVEWFFNDLKNYLLSEGETLSVIIRNYNFDTTLLIGEVIAQCAMKKINLDFLYYDEYNDKLEKQEFRFYLLRDEF
jgi:hypothetical protein